MREEFSRTEMILGPEAVKKLEASKVAVFGIGGVVRPCGGSPGPQRCGFPDLCGL